MIVSMKKSSRLFTPGLAQSFLICLTLLCWAEKNHPIIIFALMFIFCVAIIRTKIPNKRARLQKKFKQSQAYALLSLISLTLTCFILFKTEYNKSIYIIIPTITTMALSILTIRSYLTSIDNKEKTLYLYTKKMIKYTWIIFSLCGYNISRAIVSTTFDIPFDITYNRPITFITSLVFIFLAYYFLYFLLLYILFLSVPIIPHLGLINHSFSNKLKTKKCFPLRTGYHCLVLLSLFFIWIISFNVIDIYITNIFKTGANIALHYETRDSFFCHNRYMFLTEHPDARFMFISEGSYRALIPYKDDINVFRLTCSDKEPFYSLNDVVDKDSLILTAIKERANILINDLYLK